MGTNKESYIIDNSPPPSPWILYFFANADASGNIVYRPPLNGQPNWFHRKMQELVFGVKWKYEPKD